MSVDAPHRATVTVVGMSCEHCRAAVIAEIGNVAGVSGVDVDLESKQVYVTGTGIADAQVRAAVEEAGYEAA